MYRTTILLLPACIAVTVDSLACAIASVRLSGKTCRCHWEHVFTDGNHVVHPLLQVRRHKRLEDYASRNLRHHLAVPSLPQLRRCYPLPMVAAHLAARLPLSAPPCIAQRCSCAMLFAAATRATACCLPAAVCRLAELPCAVPAAAGSMCFATLHCVPKMLSSLQMQFITPRHGPARPTNAGLSMHARSSSRRTRRMEHHACQHEERRVPLLTAHLYNTATCIHPPYFEPLEWHSGVAGALSRQTSKLNWGTLRPEKNQGCSHGRLVTLPVR